MMVNPVWSHQFVTFLFSVHVWTESKAAVLQRLSELLIANRSHILYSATRRVYSSALLDLH
jgi:hypothetical protein